MKTIGIVGSRRRDAGVDFVACVEAFLKEYSPGDRIVSGGCPKGGDRFAEVIARESEIPIVLHRADWSLGRHAGFLRNGKIAEDCDVLIAVVAKDRLGGTEDTIRKAKVLGKRVVLV